MTTGALLELFEAGTVPPGGFHHEQHVQAAWGYLRRYPLAEALARFTTALQRFAAAQGAPERYHATITTAYLLLIAERCARSPNDDWPMFATANADLLVWKPSLLDRYYRPGTLASDAARRQFVAPDLRDDFPTAPPPDPSTALPSGGRRDRRSSSRT
jgi:hypothetical protein